MKTLRLLRNIAVLFILLMALLAWRPGSAVAHAAVKACVWGAKRGFTCFVDASGNCHESQCDRAKGNPVCLNSGCM